MNNKANSSSLNSRKYLNSVYSKNLEIFFELLGNRHRSKKVKLGHRSLQLILLATDCATWR